jgi:hypothetical protein
MFPDGKQKYGLRGRLQKAEAEKEQGDALHQTRPIKQPDVDAKDRKLGPLGNRVREAQGTLGVKFLYMALKGLSHEIFKIIFWHE